MPTDLKILEEIFSLSEKVGQVPFGMVIKASSGFQVIPIDMKSSEDKELLGALNDILNSYLKTLEKTRGRLQGSRPNEVGSRIEAGLVHEMTRFSLEVTQLSKKGYPDIEIRQDKNRVTYLEVKATSTVEPSGLRYFYYSSGNKVKADARHLILNISITEERDKYWKIESFSISDLSKLKVVLKAEFNASQKAIQDKTMEIFSSKI